MYRRTATWLLVVVVAAALLLASGAVSAHRPPRPVLRPPVLLGGGGDAGTWGSFGTPGRPPRGGTWTSGELGARRLGQRGSSQDHPPSPKNGPSHIVSAPEPPPPPPSVNE